MIYNIKIQFHLKKIKESASIPTNKINRAGFQSNNFSVKAKRLINLKNNPKIFTLPIQYHQIVQM